MFLHPLRKEPNSRLNATLVTSPGAPVIRMRTTFSPLRPKTPFVLHQENQMDHLQQHQVYLGIKLHNSEGAYTYETVAASTLTRLTSMYLQTLYHGSHSDNGPRFHRKEDST